MTTKPSPIEDLPKKQREEVQALQLELKQVTRGVSIFNENQVQKLFNTTAARYKYKRPGKGGGQWSYVKVTYVRRVLDSIFGFNWDFEVETSVSEAFDVAVKTKACVVKGILTGRTKIDGEWVAIKKVQFGRAEVKFKKDKPTEPLDFGNDMKAAGSDALKKCANLLGIAADVYDPEEFQAIDIVGADANDEKNKLLEEKISAAKKQLKAPSKKVGKQNDRN